MNDYFCHYRIESSPKGKSMWEAEGFDDSEDDAAMTAARLFAMFEQSHLDREVRVLFIEMKEIVRFGGQRG